MARDEAKVRVRLDTRQAKGELRGLAKEGGKAAGKVGAGIRSAVGRGMGMVGLGVGIGAGVAALRGPTQGALSAMWSQSLGPIGERLYQAWAGKVGPEAIGGAAQLQETLARHSQLVGDLNAIPPSVRASHAWGEKRKVSAAEGASRLKADATIGGNAAARALLRAAENIERASKSFWDRLGPRPETEAKFQKYWREKQAEKGR